MRVASILKNKQIVKVVHSIKYTARHYWQQAALAAESQNVSIQNLLTGNAHDVPTAIKITLFKYVHGTVCMYILVSVYF